MPSNILKPSSQEKAQILAMAKKYPEFFSALIANPKQFNSAKGMFDSAEQRMITDLINLNFGSGAKSERDIRPYILNADLELNNEMIGAMFQHLGVYGLELMAKKYNALRALDMPTRKILLQEIVFLHDMLDSRRSLMDQYGDKDAEKIMNAIVERINCLTNAYNKCFQLAVGKINKFGAESIDPATKKLNIEWLERNEAAMMMLIKMQTQSRVLESMHMLDISTLFEEKAKSGISGLDNKTLMYLMAVQVSLEDPLTRNSYIAYFNARLDKYHDISEILTNIQLSVDQSITNVKNEIFGMSIDRLEVLLQKAADKLESAYIKYLGCTSKNDVKGLFERCSYFALQTQVFELLKSRISELSVMSDAKPKENITSNKGLGKG